MAKRTLPRTSAMVGAAAGFVFYTIFALVDLFGKIDWLAALGTGVALGCLTFALSLFAVFAGKGSLSTRVTAVPTGLILGILTFIIGSVVALAFQTQGLGLLATAGAGALLGALLLGSIGVWIDSWRRAGFAHVLFRTMGFMLGIGFGYLVALVLQLGDPAVSPGGWIVRGGFAGVIFAFLGLWLGWLVDRMRTKSSP
ncbi:MAG: hypothetical protein KKB13_28765 [Chloroflexi bacterium]|nr:hypothetical protein [Chloroflexota bacterium]